MSSCWASTFRRSPTWIRFFVRMSDFESTAPANPLADIDDSDGADDRCRRGSLERHPDFHALFAADVDHDQPSFFLDAALTLPSIRSVRSRRRFDAASSGVAPSALADSSSAQLASRAPAVAPRLPARAFCEVETALGRADQRVRAGFFALLAQSANRCTRLSRRCSSLDGLPPAPRSQRFHARSLSSLACVGKSRLPPLAAARFF